MSRRAAIEECIAIVDGGEWSLGGLPHYERVRRELRKLLDATPEKAPESSRCEECKTKLCEAVERLTIPSVEMHAIQTAIRAATEPGEEEDGFMRSVKGLCGVLQEVLDCEIINTVMWCPDDSSPVGSHTNVKVSTQIPDVLLVRAKSVLATAKKLFPGVDR